MRISKSRFLLSLAFASSLLSGVAHANPAIIRDFRASAQVLPRKALAAGYQRFGTVDMADLLSQMQGLDVQVKGSISHKQGFGVFEAERDGAEWRHGGVSLSAVRWPKLKADEKPMLALHEALGALKIEDDNFGCSGSIWALTDGATRSIMNQEEVATFESYAERGCFMARSGGSTGVTGGGDDYNVRIRMIIMRQGLEKMHGAESRSDREAGFNSIAGNFYQSYGRGKNSPKRFRAMMDPNTLSMEKVPYLDTVHVYSDLDMTQEVPPGKRDGWSYDAKNNVIHVNGRYRKQRHDQDTGLGFAMRAQYDRD